MSSKYMKFFSQRTMQRKPSAIRTLIPLMKIPGVLSLGGGVPNPEVFPVKGITYEFDKYSIQISDERLKEALQYSSSYGIESLLTAWKNVLNTEHNRSDNYSLISTTGSQDGLAKCFDCILDPEDSILVEDPTYSGALAAMRPTRANIVPVPSDRSGIVPERLEHILSSWDSQVSKKPKALYIIPTGQNPGGTTIPEYRRKEIYELSRIHDFLIIEDDPYWFLHFQESPRPPSFFSMDSQEGRVVRLDSLSKVVAAGLRVGFVAGPHEFIEKLQLDQQASAMHSSGVSQTITATILETWGLQGLHNHVAKIQDFYKYRRNLLLKYADQYLSDLATWNVPEAGMFVWFECKNKNVDCQHLLDNYAKEEKILIVPGASFFANYAAAPRYTFRVSFSLISEETAEECLKRLRALLLHGDK